MSELVFLLEEASARAMLKGFLPRLLSDDIPVRYIVFEGKQGLERQLVRRLRGYRKPGARFVVMRDKDAADCHQVKNSLLAMCRQAGKPDTLIRIACHELESWYLGDLAAVERGLDMGGLSAKQNQNKYRTPDRLSNAANELEKLTKYRYQKVGGSRAISPFLDPDNNRSHSFNVFVDGLKRLISDVEGC